MVEISETTENGAGDAQSTATPGLFETLKNKPVDTALWALRILTVVFGFLYAFPVLGLDTQAQFFSRTLIAAAATNALRLHQRLGGFRFSREFLAEVFLEDACHYLFYSVVFLGCSPATMCVLPVFLFAVLHAANFTVKVFAATGNVGSPVYKICAKITEQYSHTLLSVIAFTEITLMPTVVVMVFMSRCSFFVPFIYYRFLTLRYVSRRNPNTRVAFNQLRRALEEAVSQDRCPPAIRSGAHKIIELIAKLAPQMQPVQ